MIATTIGLSTRMWLAGADPDSAVQTAGGIFPDIGEFFMNTATGGLFVCTQGGGTQTWQATTNTSMVLALIAANVLQSDWQETNSSAQDFIKNKPGPMTSAATSRSLNTAFQVSSTRWSTVRYSVDISTTVSLAGSATGTVVLETATNAGFTTGVQTLQQFSNGNSGTLVVGLSLTQLCTACLSGEVPPGNYVRLRTVNNVGTPTFTYQTGQEVLI